MRMLVALLLAQNINVTPIEVRQDGVRLPTRQRQYVVDCRANMTCAIDGGILFLSAASGGSGGGKVAEAYMADASITAQVATVARTAYAADASVYAVQAQYLPITCAPGQFITCTGTSCSCATPSGGGGSANYLSGVLTFDGGYDSTTTVTAAWATGSSSVICGPVGEEASLEGLNVTPLVLSSGSFTVRGEPRTGRHSGSLSFVCTGL